MGAFSRFVNVCRAKLSHLLDRFEDPRDVLDQSYNEQMASLQTVRRGVADVVTARKRLEMQASQLRSQADKLHNQAKQAMSIDREDLAREALSRRAAIGVQLDDLGAQHEQILTQEQRLLRSSQELQSHLAVFRTRKESLKASYSAAEAQTRVGEAVAGISGSMNDAGLAMQRAQDKVASMQARAAAIDELLASGALTDLTSGRDDIDAQLQAVASKSQVDADLAQLRRELAGSGAPAPALPPGGASPGAVGSPRAVSGENGGAGAVDS